MTSGRGAGDDLREPAPALLDGRYEIGDLIAQGGMSSVYRGVDRRLDRPVAIKVMRNEYAGDPSFLTRFEREARAAAGLHHPGVVAVYDQGRDGDTVFLVMELVDGGTLRDLLREQGALSVPLALSVLEPVLSALGAAHEAGLVHRDVKPENVLISTRGEVKVADFGLVRAVTSTTMATGDVILGTVAYLSPEQVATGFSDARSDVYAAGIVAFEMLTGTTPFHGDTAISVAYQHVHSDVPAPSTLAPGVPEPLDDILVRATARDAEQRQVDAAALLAELIRMRARLLIRRVPVPVPTPAPVARRMPRPTTQTVDHLTEHLAPEDQATAWEQTRGAADVTTAVTRPAVEPRTDRARLARTAAAPRGSSPLGGTRPGRRRRRRTWVILVVLALLVAAAAVTGWWFGSGRYTSVPQLVGIAQDSAVTSVRDADLVPVVTTSHHDTIAAGRVASVLPGAGEQQLRGSEVHIVVSSGRPTVPQIAAGTPPTEAISTLTAADLSGAVDPARSVYDPAVPSGQLVTTDPAAGTELAIGSMVTVIVSKGPEPVKVPPVADKTVDDATNALKVAGLTLGPTVMKFDPARRAGIVIGTLPAEGSSVTGGSSIQLVVSNGIEVPAVVGASQQDAATVLGAAGLHLVVGSTTFDRTVDGGHVISSNPTAGVLVDPANATVTVVLSNAITMPNLVGRDLQAAGTQLTDAGLYVQVTTFFGFGSTVESQDPAPGTRVAPGSTVSLSTFS